MTIEKIIALRLERQHLLSPIGKEDYNELFRLLSPVQTSYWTAPGTAPVLPLRADFDDIEYNDKRRSKREILKGRFQNGNIAYVDHKDLALYACAYRKGTQEAGYEELRMLQLLQQEGPLNIGTIKEITGMLVKHITPILHKLQKEFLIYEDQIDSEGDRAWYVFESEFPEIDLTQYTRIESIAGILQRFMKMNVLTQPEEIKSFFHFTTKDIQTALSILVEQKQIQSISLSKDQGYILTEDIPEITAYQKEIPSFTVLLNRNDFLAKTTEYKNKKRFAQKDFDILHYIMIDGQICGALLGKFKFGPHILEDIVLDLPTNEQQARKQDILQAVYDEYDEKLSPLQNYCGQTEK